MIKQCRKSTVNKSEAEKWLQKNTNKEEIEDELNQLKYTTAIS
jgi:hypothetical protein